MNSEVGVILPTYGEAENISKLIEDIENLKLDASILVIDDSSPDGTAEIVQEKQKKYPNITLYVRPKKTGLGTAITDGFKIFLIRQATPKIRFHNGCRLLPQPTRYSSTISNHEGM